MDMETIIIVVAFVTVALVAAIGAAVRRAGRKKQAPNIYPLW